MPSYTNYLRFFMHFRNFLYTFLQISNIFWISTGNYNGKTALPLADTGNLTFLPVLNSLSSPTYALIYQLPEIFHALPPSLYTRACICVLGMHKRGFVSFPFPPSTSCAHRGPPHSSAFPFSRLLSYSLRSCRLSCSHTRV